MFANFSFFFSLLFSFVLDSVKMCSAITAASGPAVTTNTATMVLAQQQQSSTIPEAVIPLQQNDDEINFQKSSSRRSRKESVKKSGSKRAKRMKKSPSTVSPNSDEIRKESLALEREHSSGGAGGSISCARPTCAMCGSSLSKSISQASNFSNVIVERPSDSGSVQTTASAQAALQGTNALKLQFLSAQKEREKLSLKAPFPYASATTLSKRTLFSQLHFSVSHFTRL